MTPIRIYGAEWCEDTAATCSHLDLLGIPYDYIDIDRDPEAAAWVCRHNAGRQRTPTVDVDGQIVTEPSNIQLETLLRGKGLMS